MPKLMVGCSEDIEDHMDQVLWTSLASFLYVSANCSSSILEHPDSLLKASQMPTNQALPNRLMFSGSALLAPAAGGMAK